MYVLLGLFGFSLDGIEGSQIGVVLNRLCAESSPFRFDRFESFRHALPELAWNVLGGMATGNHALKSLNPLELADGMHAFDVFRMSRCFVQNNDNH